MDLTKLFTKPEGFLGRISLSNMNVGHKKICNWALDQIDLQNYNKIIDLGCGGGATIKRIVNRTENAIVTGIDYSIEAVEKSKKTNKDYLDKRVNITQASVEKLPFGDNEFDMAIAVETIYFWPNIIDSLKEVNRILKPNADFYIICESTDKNSPFINMMQGMTIYDRFDYERILSESNFKDIDFVTKENTDWIMIKCKKR